MSGFPAGQNSKIVALVASEIQNSSLIVGSITNIIQNTPLKKNLIASVEVLSFFLFLPSLYTRNKFNSFIIFNKT